MTSCRLLPLVALSLFAGCATNSSGLEPITPERAVAELEAGNRRFLDGGMHAHEWQVERQVETGFQGQHPSVGILSCADSRVPPEIIFDQGVGDLFVVRVAGNSESEVAVGTFEYGVAELGVHTIVVLGHTRCGAVEAALAGKPLPGSIPAVVAPIEPALVAGSPVETPDARLDRAIEANVRWQMERMLDRSEILRDALAKGRLRVHGAIYDVRTGAVRFLPERG